MLFPNNLIVFSFSYVFSARLLLTLTCSLFVIYQGNLPVKRRITTVTVTLSENERMLDRLERNWSNFSEKEQRAWVAAFVIEFIVIFLLNAFTLAIYIRNRYLRKRRTYLIINLTVVDLLVGTVAGPSIIFEPDNLETDLCLEQDFSWQSFVYLTLRGLF